MSGALKDEKRITRNWVELLQELRVAQTGVQILTGFLLTVPFSNRFSRLTDLQLTTYLCVLVGAIATSALLVAPVVFHRMLFRQQRRPWLVQAAHVSALSGLALLSLVSCGAAFLAFDIGTSTQVASVVGGGLLAFFVVLWCVPLVARARYRRKDGESSPTAARSESRRGFDRPAPPTARGPAPRSRDR
ncbi:MAG: DUF6328 family protein [Marmoricola sp.]